MICQKGLCLVCGKEIAKPCPSCGSGWQNVDSTNVELTWSNGSKMSIPVCTECSKEAVWKADKKELTQAIWDAWDKLGGTYSKEVVLV